MSMPNYAILIDVCLSKPIAADNIWLRHIRYLPFVPVDGQVIRLTSEDEESTLDLTLAGVLYDVSSGRFECSIEDDAVQVSYNTTGMCKEADAIACYTPFGFVRLNFPTVQVR